MAKENTIEDLRQLGIPELKEKLVLARKALFELKLKRSELKDPHKARWARRDVAKILTLIREKEIYGQRKGK